MSEGLDLLKEKIECHHQRSRNKRSVHYSKELKKKILIFLKKENMKVSQFCKKTGISSSTVHHWKKDFSSVGLTSGKDYFQAYFPEI